MLQLRPLTYVLTRRGIPPHAIRSIRMQPLTRESRISGLDLQVRHRFFTFFLLNVRESLRNAFSVLHQEGVALRTNAGHGSLGLKLQRKLCMQRTKLSYPWLFL